MSSRSLPPVLSNSHIGLYGLSANPPTGESGHLGIIQYYQSTSIFNEIWIIPVYKHMFSSKSNMIDFEHRVKMCELSFLDSSMYTNNTNTDQYLNSLGLSPPLSPDSLESPPTTNTNTNTNSLNKSSSNNNSSNSNNKKYTIIRVVDIEKVLYNTTGKAEGTYDL